MIAQSAGPARPLLAISAIVAIGVLVALATVLALTLVRPVLIAFALVGIALFLPTFVMRDPRAYWLFLLFVSIPFDIYKRTTNWIIDWSLLLQKYGLPPVETLSLDVYVTDVVWIVMLLPWLARLCLRRDRLYFPKIGYIFLLYLAYMLVDSVLRAESFYLSIFDWCRQLLYFLSFIYIANNVVTRSQLRAVVLALLVGLVIETGAVIALFHLDIGTGHPLFFWVYSADPHHIKVEVHGGDRLETLYAGESGAKAHIKRSAGTFGHPVLAGYYIEFILPIVLGYLVTVRSAGQRLLYGAMLSAGWLALYLTFARSALIGSIGGCFAFFPVARWARLISRRTVAWFFLILAIAALLSTPLVIGFLWSRPIAANTRVVLIKAGLHTFWERPIFGAGLNNSSAVLTSGQRVIGGKQLLLKLHNYYLVVLVDGGIIGFLLFYSFFWQIVMTAFRSLRAAEAEMKLVLVGIVAALASIAVHNLGDPFQGHVTSCMLWFYAGLIVAISRRVQAERAPPDPGQGAAR